VDKPPIEKDSGVAGVTGVQELQNAEKSYFRRSILSEQLTSVAVSQGGATPELL
jgi:hypothetical protein